MTLFLIALHFWNHTIELLIIDSISLNVICWKQNAMKLVRCVCDCVWIYLTLHSLKLLSKKHSSFVCRLNGHRAELPTTSVVPSAHRPPRRGPAEARSGQTGFRRKAPEAERRCTLRRATATSRLRSFWSPKVPRWTPRATVARASIREAGARNRVSNLGHFKIWQKWFGLEITAFSVNVRQSRGFALLMLGSMITNSMSVSQSCSQKIDNHLTSYMTFLMTLLLNASSIYEQKLKYYRLCFIEGNLSDTRCIETCSMCLWMVFCFAQFDSVKKHQCRLLSIEPVELSWDLELDFRSCHWLFDLLDDIVFSSLFNFWKQSIKPLNYRQRFIGGNFLETKCHETCSMCLWLCVNISYFAQFEAVE